MALQIKTRHVKPKCRSSPEDILRIGASEERELSKVDRAWNHFLPKVNPRNGGEEAPTISPMPDRAGEKLQFRHGHFIDVVSNSNMAP